MKKFIKLMFLAIVFSGTANAAYVGNNVEFTYLEPTDTTVVGSAVALVGNNVEYVGIFNVFDIDILDTSINIGNFRTANTFPSVAFSGWTLLDDSIDAIVDVTINSLTNMVGLDSSRLFFADNGVAVNWQGLSFDSNTIISLDVQFAPNNTGAPVPEPSVLWLLGLSGIAIAIAGMRKKLAA